MIPGGWFLLIVTVDLAEERFRRNSRCWWRHGPSWRGEGVCLQGPGSTVDWDLTNSDSEGVRRAFSIAEHNVMYSLPSRQLWELLSHLLRPTPVLPRSQCGQYSAVLSLRLALRQMNDKSAPIYNICIIYLYIMIHLPSQNNFHVVCKLVSVPTCSP